MKLLVMSKLAPVPVTAMPPPWLPDTVDRDTVTAVLEAAMPPPWFPASVDRETVSAPPDVAMPPPWLPDRVDAVMVSAPPADEIPTPWFDVTRTRVRASLGVPPLAVSRIAGIGQAGGPGELEVEDGDVGAGAADLEDGAVVVAIEGGARVGEERDGDPVEHGDLVVVDGAGELDDGPAGVARAREGAARGRAGAVGGLGGVAHDVGDVGLGDAAAIIATGEGRAVGVGGAGAAGVIVPAHRRGAGARGDLVGGDALDAGLAGELAHRGRGGRDAAGVVAARGGRVGRRAARVVRVAIAVRRAPLGAGGQRERGGDEQQAPALRHRESSFVTAQNARDHPRYAPPGRIATEGTPREGLRR